MSSLVALVIFVQGTHRLGQESRVDGGKAADDSRGNHASIVELRAGGTGAMSAH